MTPKTPITYYRISFLIVPVASIAADGWFDIIFVTTLTVALSFYLDYKAGNLPRI